MIYTVIMANKLAIRQRQSFIIAQYNFTEIFAVFNVLSKSAMVAMVDGFISTGGLPPYVLDGIFNSFSDESLSDADDRNNNDVSKLSAEAGGKMDTDSDGIYDGYSDVSDDECDGVNAFSYSTKCTLYCILYHSTLL